MIWAVVKTQFEGFHYWDAAPDEVGFLGNKHRHIFWVEIWIEQYHNERDVEYISEKRKLNEFLGKHYENKTYAASCETIATTIKNEWQKKYPNRKIRVCVFEDGENGTVVE